MAVKNLSQNIENINLNDLTLWSENPRQPIGKTSNDEIIAIALEDKKGKWKLDKLYEEMGGADAYYDCSDLPTVVKENGKNIIYDGNKRIILVNYLKNSTKFANLNISNKIKKMRTSVHITNLEKIPCNVCNLETALSTIERKHIGSGSWDALERDIFLAEYMNRESSDFLIFEWATKLISENDKLNQNFVKDEVLKEVNMNSIGFSFEDKKVQSVYNNIESKNILHVLAWSIKAEKITTRKRLDLKYGETLATRLGKVIPQIGNIIKSVEGNEYDLKVCGDIEIGEITVTNLDEAATLILATAPESTKKGYVVGTSGGGEGTSGGGEGASGGGEGASGGDEGTSGGTERKPNPPSEQDEIYMFPNILVLKKNSLVNDIYSDIRILVKLWHWQKNNPTNIRAEDKLSQKFYRILRFALRLIMEVAAADKHKGEIGDYVKDSDFDRIYQSLIQVNRYKDLFKDHKITSGDKFTSLLQKGGHDKITASNYEETFALSIIAGYMLEKSHGDTEET